MSIKYANLSEVNSTLYCFSQCHIFTHTSIKTVGQGHQGFTKLHLIQQDCVFILICEDYACNIPQLKKKLLVIYQIM